MEYSTEFQLLFKRRATQLYQQWLESGKAIAEAIRGEQFEEVERILETRKDILLRMDELGGIEDVFNTSRSNFDLSQYS
jgi:hypothetical protein